MKTLFYSIITMIVLVGSACKSSKGNLSLRTTDTTNEFKFVAEYDTEKTPELKNYLDSALNNSYPLDKDIDLYVNLNGKDKFNLKTKEGFLEIDFDKRNSSPAGYIKVKKLTEGIQKAIQK